MRGEDVPVKVDDHGVDALRYGVMTCAVPKLARGF
jgi:hypothetical protein